MTFKVQSCGHCNIVTQTLCNLSNKIELLTHIALPHVDLLVQTAMDFTFHAKVGIYNDEAVSNEKGNGFLNDGNSFRRRGRGLGLGRGSSVSPLQDRSKTVVHVGRVLPYMCLSENKARQCP